MATGRVPTTANSPLTAKGDLFTYDTSQARLAVGNNGETLVADSSATTGLRWTATPSASNPILNGGFDIWQRGTSISLAASAGTTYLADRWCTQSGTNQALTVSRQTTGDSTNLPNIQYCLRYQRNSGQTGTGQLALVQNLETVNSIPYAGKTIALSFYARKGANYSAASDALVVQLISGTGTDQNAFSAYTGAVTAINQTATLTTTWQRFTYTGTLSSTLNEFEVQFNFTPTGTASTNDYFEVTGIQVDIGSVALPFRRTGGTLAGELAACQRYYTRVTTGVAYGVFNAAGSAASTTNINYIFTLPVRMRVTPTALEYSTVGASDLLNAILSPSAFTIVTTESTTDSARLQMTVTGATQYRPYFIYSNNSTSAYIGFTAEL